LVGYSQDVIWLINKLPVIPGKRKILANLRIKHTLPSEVTNVSKIRNNNNNILKTK
jgi:hypothetical protein